MPKSCFYPLLLLLGGSLPLLAQEWVTLFDGKSFAGWDNRPIAGKLAWTIEDGCLTAIPGSTRADLMTLREFRDFELEFEWKVPPAGNSGVKYKLQAQYYFSSPRGATKSSEVIILPHLRPAPEAGRLAVIGFEYQVAADDTTADTKRGAKWASGAVYEYIPAVKSKPALGGQFHKGRIVVRGMSVEHWLDGEKVASGALDAPGLLWATPGSMRAAITAVLLDLRREASPIALQHHNTKAWYRNIRVRELR